MPNPHCVCPASGFCSRHKINKDQTAFIACQGNASTTDGGRKMWIAWEQGMLGATRPGNPVDNPEPFRQGFARPTRSEQPRATLLVETREHRAILDSYKRPYSYPAIECADLRNAVRHLTFHVWPVTGTGAWQWNCDRLIENAELFNGQRIVAIVTSGETDTADKVKNYLRGFTDDFIVMRNDGRLREVATWVPMLRKLEAYQSESDVTFSCHGKCVRHKITPESQGSTIFEWTQAMYDTCLRWDGFGPWHYSGTFYWWRNRDAFRRNWRYTPNHFFGTEAWPGIIFDVKESGVIFCDDTGDLYDKAYFDSKIKPRLEEWKVKHSQGVINA